MHYVQRLKKYAVIGGALLVMAHAAVSQVCAGGSATIAAAGVKSDPASLTDAAWKEAKPVTVAMDGVGDFKNKKKEVQVKAVYTKNGRISFLLTWEDPTRSVDGNAWVRKGDAWQQKEGGADRVALNFETRRIKNFANKGCAVLCHAEKKNPKEWKYHTERAPQLGDLWVWDSYTSDPMGHAGDYYVDDDSRKADKGSGKPMKNINKFGNGPIFMGDPAKKPSRTGFLMDSEKVAIGNAAVPETPLYMLAPFSGDFADITAQAKHDGGKWTVMLQRKLETKSDTDVQFNTRKKYNLGIAVFENSGMYTKYTSPPLKLDFK